MVLEISATPYIFTFKLWDWGRLGMDGLPRPIHLDHGMKNIQWNRDTKWVYDNIVGQQKILEKTETCEVERTGLHSREFIDTIRYTLSGPHTVSMDDTVHVMNLVEGRSARIESMDGSFAPFTVHYAETAIVPAAVGTYRIVPEEGEMIKMLDGICGVKRDKNFEQHRTGKGEIIMTHKIREVYIVHHSHTDVGYTDLQEQVIYNQANNIRRAVELIENGIKNNTTQKDLKWNCETWYCVEQFFKMATEEEKEKFFDLVKKGNIGLSANYLNFNDLADCKYLKEKIHTMQEICGEKGIQIKTAMIADINGISMGQRDALIENGVEFLYTNIHTHHGMYPLYQNQKPYFWENENGQRLLVWNGEHYNLGNALGIVLNKNVNFMTENYFGKKNGDVTGLLENLHTNLAASIKEYEENGYPYDFYITSVSGVFSDNAPINPAIADTVALFNEKYGEEVTMHMVTLQELYDKIRDKVQDAPVYRGAINDWWGNGVGSTPYAVKHYKEAVRLNHICDRLEEKTGVHNKEMIQAYGDNSLLYAEHTWGHSATVTNPYDTMVTNLDMRKNSYASKAHEAAAMRKNEQCHKLGDILRYYNLSGKVKAVSTSHQKRVFPVEFYVETLSLSAVKVTDDKTKQEMEVQLSAHPRGVLISFLAEFEPMEEKTFTYEEQPALSQTLFTRTAWVGAERCAIL